MLRGKNQRIKKVTKEIKKTQLAVLKQMVKLATSGFGLVAALAWNNVIKELVEACKRGDNVNYYTLNAARANATEGEMRRAFTEAFGTWKPPI